MTPEVRTRVTISNPSVPVHAVARIELDCAALEADGRVDGFVGPRKHVEVVGVGYDLATLQCEKGEAYLDDVELLHY